MDTALLIIDVQQAICSGKYEAFDSRGVIERINHVSRLAREAGAPVVIIQHEEKSGPMAHGSDGWKLDPDLIAMPTDVYVRKEATDSFHNTDLQAVLEARGIRSLVICGLQSEFCVDTTTRRALALGYPVTLVADGHSTMDNSVLTASQISAHHTETLANIESFGTRARAVRASDIRFET